MESHLCIVYAMKDLILQNENPSLLTTTAHSVIPAAVKMFKK